MKDFHISRSPLISKFIGLLNGKVRCIEFRIVSKYDVLPVCQSVTKVPRLGQVWLANAVKLNVEVFESHEIIKHLGSNATDVIVSQS